MNKVEEALARLQQAREKALWLTDGIKQLRESSESIRDGIATCSMPRDEMIQQLKVIKKVSGTLIKKLQGVRK